MARSGYTLPVFAVAAAKAALRHLQQHLGAGPIGAIHSVTIDLLPESAEIPVQQVAMLDHNSALAITVSDPGDNLDLTRYTPIWAKVAMGDRVQDRESLILLGGEGLGKDAAGDPAIYRYAKRLFEANLGGLIPDDQTVTVTVILPEGRQLAQRTSNAAFGIVDGLSLLGTSGIAKPFSAEEHLTDLRQALRTKASVSPRLVFCIGSNGIQVADRLGIPDRRVVQTGNWIGAMLVEAGLCGVQSVLLLGYQGKLLKLAGGIFNTSSHLADAKREILCAAAIRCGENIEIANKILIAKTADEVYQKLVNLDCYKAIFENISSAINENAKRYVKKYADVNLSIDNVLCDRQGEIIVSSGEIDQWRS
jgi:cobalt-precorrin-5B (C1)-methyltransferase